MSSPKWVQRSTSSFVNWLRIRSLHFYTRLSLLYIKLFEGEKETSAPLTSLQKRGEREMAALDLAAIVPFLSKSKNCPFYLGAVPSFLWEYVREDMPFCPAVDVIFPNQGIFFSFSEKTSAYYQSQEEEELVTSRELINRGGFSSVLPGRDRLYLEDLFSKRLNLGKDAIPLLPIFLSYKDVRHAKDPESLALIINRAWNDTLVWALGQLPTLPESYLPPADNTGLGTWQERRRFIQESQGTALFPLATLPKN